MRLRVKDLDLGLNQIIVRDAKGRKDRITVFPESLREPLQRQLRRVHLIHERDLARGYGRAALPYALAR